MALEYFLYRTDFNNTLIDRNVNAFTLGANEGQIQIDFLIPRGQSLPLYRESGGTIVENSQTTINSYFESINSISENTSVEYSAFTGFTTTNLNSVNAASNGGVLFGLGLSINTGNTTQYIVASGAAQIINYTRNSGNVNKTVVQYSGGTFTPTGLTSETITYVALTTGGTIIEQSTRFTSEEKTSINELGTISHPNLTNIAFVFSRPEVPYDPVSTIVDFQDFIRIGKFNQEDFNIIPSAGTLSFTTTEGTLYRRGGNFSNNYESPDVTTISRKEPQNFQYINRFGVVVDSGFTNTLIPNQYEDSGGNVLTITGSNNQALITRLWLVESGRVFAQRGQQVFSTLTNAVANIIEERKEYETPNSLIDTGLLIGEVVHRASAIDLSNPRDGFIVPTDKLGNAFGGSVDAFYQEDNIEVIKTKSSFPTPDINDDILLQADTVYRINGTINLGTSRLVFSDNTEFIGLNTATDIILGSNPNAMMVGTGNTVGIDSITFLNFNTGGTIFDFIGGSEENLIINRAIFINSGVGRISDFDLTLITNCKFDNIASPLVFSDNSLLTTKLALNNLLFEKNITSSGSYIVIDTGSYNAININNSFFQMKSGITGITVNSGVTVQSGKISENEFISSGATTLGSPIVGVSNETPKWVLNNNVGLGQGTLTTSNFSFLRTLNNTTLTTINSTATYVKAQFSNATDSSSVNFILTNNRTTYDGDTDQTLFVFILNGDITSTNNGQTLRVAVYKNGTQNIVEQEVSVVTGDVKYPYGLNGIVTLNIGDFLEVFVRNTTQTRDIRLTNTQFRLSLP